MTCANAALVGTQNQQVKINKQAGRAQVLAPWRRVNAELVKTKWFFAAWSNAERNSDTHTASATAPFLEHMLPMQCQVDCFMLLLPSVLYSFCMFWSITCFYVRSLCEQSIRMCYLHEASRPWTARPCFALIIHVHSKMFRAHMRNILLFLILNTGKQVPTVTILPLKADRKNACWPP